MGLMPKNEGQLELAFGKQFIGCGVWREQTAALHAYCLASVLPSKLALHCARMVLRSRAAQPKSLSII